MKKTAILALSLTIGAILAGCSSGGSATANNKAACAAFGMLQKDPQNLSYGSNWASPGQRSGNFDYSTFNTEIGQLSGSGQAASDSGLRGATSSFLADRADAMSDKESIDSRKIVSICTRLGYASLVLAVGDFGVPLSGTTGNSGNSGSGVSSGNSGTSG